MSFNILLPELRQLIICNLDPLSLRRYSLTSKDCHAEAKKHIYSIEHGTFIAKDAINYIANLIVRSHSSCGGINLVQNAVEFSANMASTLAKTDKPLIFWNNDELLNFLYPTSMSLISNWGLAPYAIEWCAVISGNKFIQTAFTHDPIHALSLIKCEWAEGNNFAEIAISACKTKSELKLDITNCISSLAFAAGQYADTSDKLSYISITWAITVATIRSNTLRSKLFNMYILTNLVAALRSLSKFTSSRRSTWLNQLGFIGFDRSPHYMMSDFKCDDSPEQDLLVYAAMINENEFAHP